MLNPIEFEKSPYIIGIANPEDAPGIYEVMRTTWLNTYPNEELGISYEDIRARIEGEHGEDAPVRIEKWRKAILDPNKTVFVAKEGNRVVGYVAPFYDEKNQQRRIGGLYVLPETQGKGVGYKLINKSIESFGREHDIFLHVVTYNTKTREFYERQGFIETGRDMTGSSSGLKDGRYIPEIEMVLPAISN
jgi:ribosomal protein S18 acetylase RimI-like enzyme